MASSPRYWTTFLLVLALSAFVGCSSSGGKGSESEMPVDGSADSWRSPTLHGDLVFGQSHPADFDGVAFYHAWDFTLSGSAQVELEVGNPSDRFDTVMYLYRSDEAGQNWGSYIARNDDWEDSLRSFIAADLDQGRYRVMIKGYSQSLRGEFSLEALCGGGGCESQAPGVCLFGQDMAELEQLTGYTMDGWGYVGAGTVSGLSAVAQEQIVIGASDMEGRPVDLNEAVTYNDDQEIRIQAFDAAAGRQFVAYSYYLGDTLVGFLFNDGEAVQAMVQDGYLEQCRPTDAQGSCLFGEELFELEQNPEFQIGGSEVINSGNLDQLSTMRLAQLMLGLAELDGQAVSFPEYWDWIDEGTIWMRDLTAPDGRTFVLFSCYQGDTRVGFIFQEAEAVQATIGDGEIGDCTALVNED